MSFAEILHFAAATFFVSLMATILLAGSLKLFFGLVMGLWAMVVFTIAGFPWFGYWLWTLR